MTSGRLDRVAAWCERRRLPWRRLPDAVWMPNPAAPRYGVLVREVDGGTEWSMPFPIPARPDCLEATLCALTWLNQWPVVGAWELRPDRTIRFYTSLPDERAAGDAALMAAFRTVADAGNAHVHALVLIMTGRASPGYVISAIGG